ncbi:hypothetical protein KEM55_001378, partial [Ascosphaera atra]
CEEGAMLGQSRWASEGAAPKEQATPKKPLVQPSRWATAETGSSETVEKPKQQKEQEASSSKDGENDAGKKRVLIQPSKWASAEDTPIETPSEPKTGKDHHPSKSTGRSRPHRGRKHSSHKVAQTKADEAGLGHEAKTPQAIPTAVSASESTTPDVATKGTTAVGASDKTAETDTASQHKESDTGFSIKGRASRQTEADDAKERPEMTEPPKHEKQPQEPHNEGKLPTDRNAAPTSTTATSVSQRKDDSKKKEGATKGRRGPYGTYLAPHLRRRLEQKAHDGAPEALDTNTHAPGSELHAHGSGAPSKHATTSTALPLGHHEPIRHPGAFEEVSPDVLRYNPHHGEDHPGGKLEDKHEEDIAQRMSSVHIHDKHDRKPQEKHFKGRRPHVESLTAEQDLRAQAEERERNRQRKLQSAKSRGWDARKDEHGLSHPNREEDDDVERQELRNRPDRRQEDIERRKQLLANDDEGDSPSREIGRLEPIDFGDQFSNTKAQDKKSDGAGTAETGKDSKGTSSKMPKLPPLPDLLPPGKSWADLMDEDEEE